MQSSIGDKLKSLRAASGLSAEQVVKRLKEKNIVISAKTLYGYENNISVRSSVFLALCEIYGVTNILDTFLDAIPPAPYEWYPSNYEDYFNGRTVNEKYKVLSVNGIPDFKGYEQNCASDVFFGKQVANNDSALSNDERQLLAAYRNLNHEGQKKVCDYAHDLENNDHYKKGYQPNLVEKAI